MIAIDYHGNLKEAQGDARLAALEARAPFDRLEWWRMLAEECLSEPPLLAVARDGEDALALPLLDRGGGRLAALANWYSFSVRAVSTAGAHRVALLASLARDLKCQAHTIGLAPLSVADMQELRAAFRGAGWFAFARQSDVNHHLPVGGRDFAAYWQGRPGRLRETVRRKRAKGQVELSIATAFDAAHWEAYEAVYAASWKPAEGNPAFLRRFALAEGAAGRLRLGQATIDGRPVAAQLWTVEHGTAFIHKLAHVEDAKAHSPGTLLTAALLEHAIDRDRVEEVDFGTGDDPYKRDWMEAVRLRFTLELYRPGNARVWPGIARAAARKALGRA